MPDGSDRSIRGLIVAFDDVLVATRALRTAAWREAALAEGLDLPADRIEAIVAVGGLDEAVAAGWPELANDPTRATLIGLRAAKHFATRMAQGAPFAADVVHRVHAAAAAGCRIVIRADSPRPIVTRALETTLLPEAIGLLVCADDAGLGTPDRAWRLIDQRLTRVGIVATARLAVEVRPDARQAAAPFARRIEPWNSAVSPSYLPA